MPDDRAVVIGAGIGGLVAALLLASRGLDVTVVEAASAPGGKMREVCVAGRTMDAGPTVFTMRNVFEGIFAEAGERLTDHIGLTPVTTLARHAWSADERLDLFADRGESADAIGRFAGVEEGRRYLAFCAEARAIHDTLERTFMGVERPTPFGLVRRAGIANMLRTRPFSTMWDALGQQFGDQRLRQLFGRYATYCGSSPYLAPATLMLIAHVEQEGVWLVEGGMHRLAQALAGLIERRGGRLRCGEKAGGISMAGGRVSGVILAGGGFIPADVVVSNVDTNSLAIGHLGAAAARSVPATAPSARSLSAVTWNLVARTQGFPLVRHSVFFSRDYKAEFDDIFRLRRLPREPTVYVCAQDRDDRGDLSGEGPERLLVLVNAPATGDTEQIDPEEIAACEQRTFSALERCGLTIERQPEASLVTTPAAFERLFPATGGALYGRASHGAMASFSRPASRARLPGLYLTGGSVHPGAGVPMVALSGQIAARSVIADLASMRRSQPGATPGGTSMP